MPLPKTHLPPMGATDSFQIQPQRREMPSPGTGISAPPIAEIPASATAPPVELPPTAPLPTTSPCTATPHTASRARLLQTADIPPETARLVRCHNLWPTEDVLFCPDDTLPAFVAGIPALSSGSKLWIAIHNHRSEPLQLHLGQNIDILEMVTLNDTPPPASQTPASPHCPSLPERLSRLQQQQLNELFREFSDFFSQGEDNLGSTPLLEHTIETRGPPLRQPYRRQNPAVRREEMAQVQQMLASNVICPSNSPWASPVVMVRKKDGSLRFCADFHQLNAATVKDTHPLPQIDNLLDALHGLSGSPPCPSQSRARRRLPFKLAAVSCMNLTRSPLVFVMLPPPSPASWTASSPASTGKRACSSLTILLYFRQPGKNISLDFAKSLSGSGTLTLRWGPTNAHLRPKRSTT